MICFCDFVVFCFSGDFFILGLTKTPEEYVFWILQQSQLSRRNFQNDRGGFFNKKDGGLEWFSVLNVVF